MGIIQKSTIQETFFESSLGKKKADVDGAPVSGSRMDTLQAYAKIPDLLSRVINNDDTSAWKDIIKAIDYIYLHLDKALSSLNEETGFADRVKKDIQSGKKLAFKPNLVGPCAIHPVTHGEDLGCLICTDWSVIAALMRWFHDNLDISYHQMLLGEASTSVSLYAQLYSGHAGRTVTPEAIYEGRCGNFYGGWAFYFVRKYLSAQHPSSHTDDPMIGYEESVAGTYLAPGKAKNRLMVYDLNDLTDSSRGRTVPVPDGANFQKITLHKVIIGGDPGDPADIHDYPGCVLVNVPKLKLHAQDLITNAIKNLGIGLYPTQCHSHTLSGEHEWEYAMPSVPRPTFKGKLPHMPWVVDVDPETYLPLKNPDGTYKATKTAGMPGTQADVIRAVQAQNTFMIHVSDCIDMINLNHNAEGIAVRVPEGYIWASLDCVALDLLCARYCFKTLPMAEAIPLKEKNNWVTEFVHHVPFAEVQGKNIVTTEGLDSPLFRYNLYKYAEDRGVGTQKYHVTGWDGVAHSPLVSVDGHLGHVNGTEFSELMTTTMYYNPTCMLWDMQKTLLSYAQAHDEVTGSSVYQEFMNGFDENQDGIIDYDENGRKGFWTPGFSLLSHALQIQVSDEEFGLLRGNFYRAVQFMLKNTTPEWNSGRHDFVYEYQLMWIASYAYEMSKAESVFQDPFVSGMMWGKGMWPSWEYAKWKHITGLLYGTESPDTIMLESLYGSVFQYADKRWNNGNYTGSTNQMNSDPESLQQYLKLVSQGTTPLNFTLYLPPGLGSLQNKPIPHVEETSDPAKMFTAVFQNGAEIW